MANTSYRATITISFRDDAGSLSDLVSASQSINGMILGGIVANLIVDAESRKPMQDLLREFLRTHWMRLRRGSPGFEVLELISLGASLGEIGENLPAWNSRFVERYSHSSSDLASQLDTFTYLSDGELHRRLFGFLALERVSRQSPLVMTLATMISAHTISSLVVFGCIRASAVVRRLLAEAEIRESEARMKRTEERERRALANARAILFDTLTKDVEANGLKAVPHELIGVIFNVVGPSIAQFGSYPKIESIESNLTRDKDSH